jgi:uncharacterized protein (TIGR02145 family)
MEYTKTISSELISKLEGAFDALKTDIKNPWVIALLKHPKAGEQIYLIAKDPTEETYYGIMEGQFSPGKQIFAIPVSNITCVEFCEVKITPFRAKPYLENGRFEQQEVDTKITTKSIEEIQIGNQVWTRRNLNVDKFRNGDSIIEAKSIQEWDKAGDNKQPAWCYYENNSGNAVLYGKLYNWYAVNDKRGLSPDGWIIPSNSDWLKMINYLGGEGIAASKLIFKRSLLEDSKSESGFDGMLGGHRMAAGHFIGNGEFCSWWSSTEDGSNTALSRGIRYGEPFIGEGHSNKGFGYFVRCGKLI